MAHVHVIDSNKSINCVKGRVGTGSKTIPWVPTVESCGASSSEIPNLDSRWIGGDNSSSDIIVDGC